MKLRPEEEVRLKHILAPVISHEKVQEMKKYIQHGRITTYEHVSSVTKTSFWLNKRLHLGADERTLATGAFLHDFYLYDWHVPDRRHRFHGFSHSEEARKNALKLFNIDRKTQDVIKNHMWPLNITKLPRSREAWIVCFADKWVSAKETILCR